jgi:murein DD-endopeptidase MepM/ murein hydrolase activator NlpD
MKSELSRLSLIINICLSVIMGLVTVCLMLEYRFFKRQTYELVQLKGHYNTCLDLLKRRIASENNLHKEALIAVEPYVKRRAEEPQPRFVAVKREPEYLKREALKYARSHNLEQPCRQLYEKHDVRPARKSSKVAPKRCSYRVTHKRIKKVTRRVAPRSFRIQESPFAKSPAFLELKKRAELICPLSHGCFWLSSPFGPRKNPNGSWGFHTGIDLAATRGTQVKAAAAGKVIQAHYHGGYGNMILLAHANKLKTRYAHLQKMNVKVGQRVTKGEVIGTVGNTGNVRHRRGRDGSHLHFEIYVENKRRVNPLCFFDKMR